MKAKPIGTTRINHNGYVLIKTERGQRRWPFLHRVIWESIHGPIPKGSKIHHKNEDKADNRIENLELCNSNAEHHKKYHLEEAKKRGRHAGFSCRGVPKSAEHRANIAAALKGKPKSVEHKKKLGDALRGRKRPEISARFKGKKLSPEHCAKVTSVWKRLHRDPITGRFKPNNH